MRGTNNQDTGPHSDDDMQTYYRTLLTLHWQLVSSDSERDTTEAVGVRYAIELLEEQCDELPTCGDRTK